MKIIIIRIYKSDASIFFKHECSRVQKYERQELVFVLEASLG